MLLAQWFISFEISDTDDLGISMNSYKDSADRIWSQMLGAGLQRIVLVKESRRTAVKDGRFQVLSSSSGCPGLYSFRWFIQSDARLRLGRYLSLLDIFHMVVWSIKQ